MFAKQLGVHPPAPGKGQTKMMADEDPEDGILTTRIKTFRSAHAGHRRERKSKKSIISEVYYMRQFGNPQQVPVQNLSGNSDRPKEFAPLNVFQETVQYFPTVSVNIILQNQKGEYLFLKRENNPVKGLFWVPGGRVLNGETIKKAARRILKQETGLEGEFIHISQTYLEEIFEVDDFDKEDRKIYGENVDCVHYITTVVVMKLKGDEDLSLDFQSSAFLWSKELPCTHKYLQAYFKVVGNSRLERKPCLVSSAQTVCQTIFRSEAAKKGQGLIRLYE